MVAYPILLEGQTRAQLAQEARSYVLAQSNLDSMVVRYIDKYAGRSTDEALRELGKEYNTAGRTLAPRADIWQAMGYFHLVNELTLAQTRGEPQYNVDSLNAVSDAGSARGAQLANTPSTSTERAAGLVISNNPEYRNIVAKELNAFLRAHSGQSPAQIRAALDRRTYDNSGIGNNLKDWLFTQHGLANDITQEGLSADMRKTYEAMLTGKAPRVNDSGYGAANAAEPGQGPKILPLAKLKTADDVLDAAIGEALKTGGYTKFPKNFMVQVAQVLNGHKDAVSDPVKFGQAFVDLDAVRKAGNASREGNVAYHAMRILSRARMIDKAVDEEKTGIPSFSTAQELNAYEASLIEQMRREAASKNFRANVDVAAFLQGIKAKEAAASAPSADGAGGAQTDGAVTTGGVARGTGRVQLYGIKDGKRFGLSEGPIAAPNPDEVPALTDVEQVKALQLKLGVEDDGMYGPVTHAAMVKAAEKEGKKAQDYNFTIESVLNAFFAFLTGGTVASTSAPAAPTDTAVIPGSDAAARAMASVTRNDVGADTDDPSVQADDYSRYVSTPQEAAEKFKSLLGIEMTPEQINRMTLENGRIHSPDILRLEKALNAVRGNARALEENGNLDARLRVVAMTEGVKPFVQAVFSGAASVADNQAPSSTATDGATRANGR